MNRISFALLALLAASPAFATPGVTLYDQNNLPIGTAANPLQVTGGSSGGGSANAATTSNGSDAQATSATNQNNVVYNYLFNGTTWDRVRGTGGAMNMILSGAIPTGANVIGGVTQSGAWAVSVSNFPATQPVQAVDNSVPTGSPFSGTTAGVIGTFDATGYASVDLYVTAYTSGNIYLEEQASDGSGNWQAIPLTAVNSIGGSLGRVQNNAFSTGLWRASITGKAMRVRINSTPSGTDTVAVLLKSAPYVAPSTYVEGGTLTDQPAVTNSSGGVTNFSRVLSSGAATIAVGAKSSQGRVYKVFACNTTTTAAFIKFYNVSTTPTAGSGTVAFSRPIPPAAAAGGLNCASYDVSDIGWYFSTGIGYTVTAGNADNDATALASGQVTQLSVEYQ